MQTEEHSYLAGMLGGGLGLRLCRASRAGLACRYCNCSGYHLVAVLCRQAVRGYFKPGRGRGEVGQFTEGAVTKDTVLYRYDEPGKLRFWGVLGGVTGAALIWLGYETARLREVVSSLQERTEEDTKINFLVGNILTAGRGLGVAYALAGLALAAFCLNRSALVSAVPSIGLITD